MGHFVLSLRAFLAGGINILGWGSEASRERTGWLRALGSGVWSSFPKDQCLSTPQIHSLSPGFVWPRKRWLRQFAAQVLPALPSSKAHGGSISTSRVHISVPFPKPWVLHQHKRLNKIPLWRSEKFFSGEGWLTKLAQNKQHNDVILKQVSLKPSIYWKNKAKIAISTKCLSSPQNNASKRACPPVSVSSLVSSSSPPFSWQTALDTNHSTTTKSFPAL